MVTERGNLHVHTPIGMIWICSIGEKISAVSFDRPADPTELPSPVVIDAAQQISAYFDHRLKKFDLPLLLNGSDHQRKVWKIIGEIPFGKTLTYAAIAERFGGSSFARAVGTACGANPIPIIVPCHRVIASDGRLTGYLGGIDRSETQPAGIGRRDPRTSEGTVLERSASLLQLAHQYLCAFHGSAGTCRARGGTHVRQ